MDAAKLKELNLRLEKIVFEMEAAITPPPTIQERWATDDLFSRGPEQITPAVADTHQEAQGTTQGAVGAVPGMDLRVKALERMVVILANRLTEATQRVPDQFIGDREFIVSCWRTLGWEKEDIRGYFSGNIIPVTSDGIEDFEDIVQQHVKRLQEETDGTRS